METVQSTIGQHYEINTTVNLPEQLYSLPHLEFHRIQPVPQSNHIPICGVKLISMSNNNRIKIRKEHYKLGTKRKEFTLVPFGN